MERTKEQWEELIGHRIRMDTYVVLERMQKGESYESIINDIKDNRNKYGLREEVDLVRLKTVQEYLNLVNYYNLEEEIAPAQTKAITGSFSQFSGGGVYGIYSNDDILYIGSTKSFKQRFAQHNYEFKNSSKPLYAKMRRDKAEGRTVSIRPILNTENIYTTIDLTRRDIKMMELALITLYRPICNYEGVIIPFEFSR